MTGMEMEGHSEGEDGEETIRLYKNSANRSGKKSIRRLLATNANTLSQFSEVECFIVSSQQLLMRDYY